MTTRTLIKLAAATLAALPSILLAQPTAHYLPGVEGIKAASLPPPGLYLRDYSVWYSATRINNEAREEVPIDPKATVLANVPRILWITKTQVLGGNLGFDALLPIKYTDISLYGGAVSDDSFGIGDICVESTISWHGPTYDAAIGYGIWAPTGSSGDLADPGNGYWTHMFTAGSTFYLDNARKWALSLLGRYEISHRNNDEDYTVGDVVTVEWGFSRAITPTIDVGLAGYWQRQVRDNRGDAPPVRPNVLAVGPEVSVFYPKAGLGWSLRVQKEFRSRSRMQGAIGTLTITKVL